MNCERFRSNMPAFLSGELDERSFEEHRQHAEECLNCADEIRSTAALVDTLKAHPDKDVPECVEARVLRSLEPLRVKSGQRTPAPIRLRSRLRGAFTVKRAAVATGLIAIAIMVGLGMLPSNRGNAVLAQVAEAMAKIETAHVIGYQVDPRTGEREAIEMWIKRPAKIRARVRIGRALYEIADDGTKRVRLDRPDEVCSVTISPSEGMPSDLLPGLGWFYKERMLEITKMGIVESRHAALPDGRAVQLIELAGTDPSYFRTVITIDEATDLLVQAEDYRDDKLVMKIEHVDYNVEIPDSVLEIKIPKNALVEDDLRPTPESSERQALRAAISEKMNEENGHMIAGDLGPGDHCGAPRHSGMKFLFVGPCKNSVWYVESRNAYYVFGKAVVTDSRRKGYRRVVEDGWLVAPYKPDRLPGIFQMRIEKPGDYRKFILPYDHGYNGFGAERIQNVGSGPLVLMMENCRIRFYGEAKIYPQGTVYHDGEMAQLHEIRSYGPRDEYDIAKADFGNLPASEIKAMKAQMEKHNRAYRRYYHDREVARERLPSDAEMGSSWGPGYGGQADHFKVDPETGLTLYYIPSRDSVYVAGRAKLVQRRLFRRTERVVENEEVDAPGPEYARWHDYRDARKQNPKLTFQEWEKEHPRPD